MGLVGLFVLWTTNKQTTTNKTGRKRPKEKEKKKNNRAY